MDWVKASQVFLNVVQAVALVVGGLWVYFKFFNSRTFARRAVLSVEAVMLSVQERPMIRVKVVLKNAGLSRIPLRPHSQVLTLWATSTSEALPGLNLTWHEVMVSEVFTTDKWVEAQEGITDEALLPVDAEGGPWLAFRVRAEVWAAPRWRWFGRVRWVTNTVIPAQLASDVPKLDDLEQGGQE